MGESKSLLQKRPFSIMEQMNAIMQQEKSDALKTSISSGPSKQMKIENEKTEETKYEEILIQNQLKKNTTIFRTGRGRGRNGCRWGGGRKG